MKNIILALVFVILMIGAAFAVTRTSTNVGVLGGAPATSVSDQKDGNCASKCSMKKTGTEQAAMDKSQCNKGEKKTCPMTGKAL